MPDLVGLSEIAELAAVRKQVVANWRARRKDFPRAAAELRSGPVFRRSDVMAWLVGEGVAMASEGRSDRRRRRVLRQFLYLNGDLVREFLAQFEGGVFDSEDSRSSTAGRRGVEGKAGLGGTGLGGALSKEETTEYQRTTQQTSASEFARLYELLADDDFIQQLPNLDEGIWNQLEAGELVEFPASIALPGLVKLLDLAGGIMTLMPVLKALGTESISAKDASAVAAFAQLGQDKDAPTSVIASLAASPRFQFLCQLDQRFLRVEGSAIEGEATILGKIQRKIPKGSTVSAIELFAGMNRLNRKQLREFERTVGRPNVPGLDLGGSSVTYPGAVLTPIAIYR